jgi:hypothetical protein
MKRHQCPLTVVCSTLPLFIYLLKCQKKNEVKLVWLFEPTNNYTVQCVLSRSFQRDWTGVDSTRFGFYFRLYFLFGFGVSVLFRGWVSHTQGQQLYTNWVTGQTNANGSRPWNREKKGQQQPLTCTTSSASQIKTRHISLLFFFPFFYFIFLFDVGFLPTGTRRLIRHLHSKSEPFSYFAGWK